MVSGLDIGRYLRYFSPSLEDTLSVPDSVSLSLSVAGINQGTEIFTNTSGLPETQDEVVRQAIQFDGSGFATGIYPYRMKLTSNYNRSRISTFVNNTVRINNQSDSSYGAGWNLDGVTKLDIQPTGDVLLVEGDGTLWEFTQPGIDFDLPSWTQEGVSTAGDWNLSSTGLSVRQDLNGSPTFFVSPDEIINTTISGFFRVETTTDNDLIGFVFGYQAPLAANGNSGNDREFLLFDWRQQTQTTANSGTGSEGFALTKVNALFTSNAVFWNHIDSPGFDVLATQYSSSNGWIDNATHTYQLIYETDRIRISIDGSPIFDVAGSFEPGRFGFYNYSQERVRYTASAASTVSPIFDSPLGDYSTLIRNLDGSFTRTFKSGTEIDFDQDGFQTSMVDRNGNTTTYGYDGNDNLTTITDPVGMVTTLEYTNGLLSKVTGPANRETLFEHDSAGNLIKITDPDGTFRQFSYDADHKLVSKISKRGFNTTYGYNFAGQNVSVSKPDGSNAFLNPAFEVGLPDLSSGIGTKSNPAPAMREDDFVATFTDGYANSSFIKTNEFGTPTEFTDALGRTTTMTTDENNNATQIIDPRGNITNITYDDSGNLLTTTNQSIGATTNITYTTDGFNNVKTVTDPNNNTTTFNYDNNGNRLEFIDPLNNKITFVYNSLGQVISRTDALTNVITFNYDPISGNQIGITDQLLNDTLLVLDSAGNITSSTDTEGKNTQFTYDPLNRVTQVIDPDLASTLVSYNEDGLLFSFTDARGKNTTSEYDNSNRIVKRTDPLGIFESLSYDNNDNLTSITKRNGDIITFEYDAVDQMIKKTLPGNVVTNLDYDDSGNLISIINPDSNLTMIYDTANRLDSVSTTGSPLQPDILLSYTYDLNNNRETMNDSLTGTTNYVYDVLNRLTSITNPSSLPILFDYDVLSRLTQTTFPNGVVSNLTYDTKSQLSSLIHSLGVNTISSFSYTYDGSGNRTSLNTTRSNTTVNNSLGYVYDNIYRLSQASNSLTSMPDESFTYDTAGNRLTKQGQTVQSVFDDANRLLEDEKFTYVYDLNGNLISKTDKSTNETTQFTYDAENKLIQVTKPGMIATYKYDGFNRRIEKVVNGAITRYVYDDSDILIEFDGSNIQIARYTFSLDIDNPLIMERSGNVFYYQTDALGSITELTDSNGAIAKSYVYDSFGNIVFQTGSIDNPFTYTAREFDSESGLFFYRARYYDSSIGRFIGEDPIGPVGGLNFYTYVNNNPINFIDPTGLLPTACKIKCAWTFGVTCYLVRKVLNGLGIRGGGVVVTVFCITIPVFICDDFCTPPLPCSVFQSNDGMTCIPPRDPPMCVDRSGG